MGNEKLFLMSLPLRERGLKYGIKLKTDTGTEVAPFTGAWIEMSSHSSKSASAEVAPFTGAWIEILECLA